MRKLIVFVILGVITVCCKNFKAEGNLNKELNHLKQERDSMLALLNQNKSNAENGIASFLTFQDGNAEEAMNFYVDLFENSKIVDIQHNQKNEPGAGKVKVGRFILNGSLFMCSDSYIKHDWTFTPGVSLFVDLKSEESIASTFEKLSEGGKVMMPLDNYGFSKKFAFVEDRFGVSWQLNLAE
ncbi:VOC family protein [uncultured Tenacibaculum sp.]|uniref:VOC family protein n=1 Tax=uncultured Tenacibaculum sp. TaxID=174713 RepID=UPI002606AC27|nr:VOC family protein [uncultured Tenacibaculum sp.]